MGRGPEQTYCQRRHTNGQQVKRYSTTQIIREMQIKTTVRDFPGGPVVKNPPYNAGDVGLIPGQGTKIPHAAGQLSPSDTTTELTSLN